MFLHPLQSVISAVDWVEVLFWVWFWCANGSAERGEGSSSLPRGIGEAVNGVSQPKLLQVVLVSPLVITKHIASALIHITWNCLADSFSFSSFLPSSFKSLLSSAIVFVPNCIWGVVWSGLIENFEEVSHWFNLCLIIKDEISYGWKILITCEMAVYLRTLKLAVTCS